ncbi:UbiX family flavin prenyltransferase [Pusillimonas noertemannii]|nr:UbiX family flavin prenyltransferase [Pusillimonas noertemannii]TFL12890.1 UbiX family flavin prenyltransferase [Pusillimonas noertemannii]
MTRRLIVGISGASGAIYGIRLMKLLRACDGIEIHLVISTAGERTISEETDYSLAEVRELAHVNHPLRNIGASIASGSFRNMGMVIAPCSVRTLGAVAYCQAENLLSRAADVTLKEGRPLILLLRETPLHAGHIKAMELACRAGAVIMPPVPAFYNRPQTLDDIVDHTVGRVLDRIGIEHEAFPRWTGLVCPRGAK